MTGATRATRNALDILARCTERREKRERDRAVSAGHGTETSGASPLLMPVRGYEREPPQRTPYGRLLTEKAVPQAPTIDTHAHYFPQSYIDLIAKLGPRCGTTVSQDASGRTFIQVGLLLRTGPIVPLFIDLDARLKEMDRQGVQVHVLSLTQPMVYWADDDLGTAAFGGVQRRDQRRTSRSIPSGCSASRRCRFRIRSSRWRSSSARRSCPASAASTSRRP